MGNSAVYVQVRGNLNVQNSDYWSVQCGIFRDCRDICGGAEDKGFKAAQSVQDKGGSAQGEGCKKQLGA